MKMNKHISSIKQRLANVIEEETKTWESPDFITNDTSLGLSEDLISSLDSVYENADDGDGIVYSLVQYDDVEALANQLPDRYQNVKDALLRLVSHCEKYLKHFDNLNENSSKWEEIDEGGFDDYYLTSKDIDDWQVFSDFINDPKINKNI